MKLKTLSILFLIVGVSCSSPKNYYFSYVEHQPIKKKIGLAEPIATNELNMDLLASNAGNTPMPEANEFASTKGKQDYSSMSKPKQTLTKKEIKSHFKAVVKEVKKVEAKSVQAASGWDNDLKMAAIFGAIGIVLGALFNVSNIIGFIGFVAIVIALVFLIKWLMRQ